MNIYEFLLEIKELKNTLIGNNEFKNVYQEGYDFIEDNEVQKENELIISKITKKVYEFIKTDALENLEIFLYNVGGIARGSLSITNLLYSELFGEYKKYLYNPSKLNHTQQDRKNLSCWVKKLFKENNNFFQRYSEKHKSKINNIFAKFSNVKDSQIISELFSDFLRLFLKCVLSFPLVEVEFSNSRDIIDDEIMTDLLYKGKKYKVKFCYLPQLKSNGAIIPGAKFYVFTINEETPSKLKNFDYEFVKQNTQLSYFFTVK